MLLKKSPAIRDAIKLMRRHWNAISIFGNWLDSSHLCYSYSYANEYIPIFHTFFVHLTDIPRYPLNQLFQYANEHLWLIALFSHLVLLFWLTTLFNVYKLVSITGNCWETLAIGLFNNWIIQNWYVTFLSLFSMQWKCDGRAIHSVVNHIRKRLMKLNAYSSLCKLRKIPTVWFQY